MEKKQFEISIHASAEKVWQTLWDDKTYRQWTSVFSGSSHAETDWKKGSKVLFLDNDGSGMVSLIEETKVNQFMSFKHIGAINKGVEDYDSEQTKAWAGDKENYTLEAKGNETRLLVEFDTKGFPTDLLNHLSSIWPKALEKVKEIAEK